MINNRWSKMTFLGRLNLEKPPDHERGWTLPPKSQLVLQTTLHQRGVWCTNLYTLLSL